MSEERSGRMSVAVSCLLLFILQISAGLFLLLLLSKVDEIPPGWFSPDDLVANGGGRVGDLFWTAEDGILVIWQIFLKYQADNRTIAGTRT